MIIKLLKTISIVLISVSILIVIAYTEYKLGIPPEIALLPNLILGSVLGVFIFTKIINIIEG